MAILREKTYLYVRPPAVRTYLYFSNPFKIFQHYLDDKVTYAYHPERIFDDTLSTIHGLSTQAANNKPSTIKKQQSNRCNHRK